MPKNDFLLLSMQEFKRACASKSLFTCKVWDENGYILDVKVKNKSQNSTTPGYPNRNSLRYTNGTSFSSITRKVEITMKEIGHQNVVYDERGYFLETKPGGNPDRKGEIYIRKDLKKKHDLKYIRSEIPYIKQTGPDFEDVPLKSYGVGLSAQCYSNIFTHIVSLMMENELKSIRDEIITVQLYLEPKEDYYGISKGERSTTPEHTVAFYKRPENYICSVVWPTDSDRREMYATIWNVLNLLGVHEIGHRFCSYCNDDYYAHYLMYYRQMGHTTWENTTKKFKENTLESFDGYYGRNKRSFENSINSPGRTKYRERRDSVIKLQDAGLFPKVTLKPWSQEYVKGYIDERDSLWFDKKLKRQTQNTIWLQKKNPFNK